MFRIAIINAIHVGVGPLAYWFSNAAEFMILLRTDESVIVSSGGAQVILIEAIQDAFSSLLEAVITRLRPALASLFEDNTVFEGGRARGSGAKDIWDVVPDVDGAPAFDTTFIIDTLDATFLLLQGCETAPQLCSQLFESIFSFIGAKSFNMFIDDSSHFRWVQGISIAFNLSRISQWAAQHNLSSQAEVHLKYLSEASQLLQMQKSDLAHLDTISSSVTTLNSLQLRRILSEYTAFDEEKPVPQTLIECLAGIALNRADRQVVEDESVDCKLQLHRNPGFLLPFRMPLSSQLISTLVSENPGKKCDLCCCF